MSDEKWIWDRHPVFAAEYFGFKDLFKGTSWIVGGGITSQEKVSLGFSLDPDDCQVDTDVALDKLLVRDNDGRFPEGFTANIAEMGRIMISYRGPINEELGRVAAMMVDLAKPVAPEVS